MSAETAKRAAAQEALTRVEPGMRLGLGTGSTAAFFVEALGRRVAEGLDVLCVPTSSATRAQATALGIPLTTLEETPQLQLTVDGADEIGPGLALIKGGGGALLQEKIVASSSEVMLVIADASKRVAALGAFPLPVEVVRFGWDATRAKILAEAGGLGPEAIALRRVGAAPFVTDEGHYIFDLSCRAIADPAALERRLTMIPGVVETGLFVARAAAAILGHPDGRTETVTLADKEPYARLRDPGLSRPDPGAT
ncbi:MAG: ribose-5-phosphate isomerase RpiA [Paracoccaceae bacterium]